MTSTDTRTYRYPIPGDHVWRASVECASGVTDDNVTFYAPVGQELAAVARVAPGTCLRSLQDRGTVKALGRLDGPARSEEERWLSYRP